MASQGPKDLSIVIAGAGIGGLTTALQLHAHGFRNIHIFEATSSLAPLGVGINVQPHAILVLRNLGLLPRLLALGIQTQELNYYNRHGDEIIREPRGMHAGYAVPQFSIHRGEFQMMLYDVVKERLGADRVHLGHALASFEQDERSGDVIKGTEITAHFIRRQDPSVPPEIPTMKTDLLIAADGINSTARKILYPEEGLPRFSGRILWRGCIEQEPYLTGASMVWAGHANQKFIAYPISNRSAQKGKSLVNWIAELRVRPEDSSDLTPPPTDWTKAVPTDRFRAPFEKWSFKFLNILDLIDETEKVFEFPMCDRDPVSRWSFGRMTLLGDAAHPMYPIGSNGASQAILDAEALTKALLSHPDDVPKALQEYQDTRLSVTAKITMANRANGPDHVMQVAEERAPDGFQNIHDVIPKEELEEIGRAYKAIAGFEKDSVNEKAKASEGTAAKLGLEHV